jgi:hypothetical protein
LLPFITSSAAPLCLSGRRCSPSLSSSESSGLYLSGGASPRL